MSTLTSLPTGPLTRARTNLSIVERLAELETGTPTAADLELFTHWSGWGPMAKAFEPTQPDQSWADIGTQLAVLLDAETTAFARAATTTAYFTTAPIVDAMWRLAVDLGAVEGAKVFEPGCGSGRFLGAAPFPIEAVGVEADPITARIAQYLNPDATIVNRQIQETTLADEAFDLVIGNVPFSDTTPTDRARGGQGHRLSLHNYCLWRGLHALRPGGLLVAITSRYTLDAEQITQRAKLAELGEFIGAIRLPKGTFHDAGTEVIADIVVMRRRAVPTETPELEPEADWLHTDPLNNSWGAPPMNRVLHKHRYWIAGEPGMGRGQYSNNELTVSDLGDTNVRVDRACEFVADVASALPPIEATGTFAPVLVQPDIENRKIGSFHFVNDDGSIVQIVPNDQGIAVPVPVKANKELRRLIVLRNAVLDLLNLEADPNTTDDALFLPRLILNKVYDDYIAHHDGAINRCTIYDRGIDPDTGIMRKSRRRPTMGGFRQDPDYVTVLSIEDYDDDTQTASKGPIFSRRVNRPQLDVTSVATGGEAVAVSMNRHGRIDRDLIASLLGITADEVPDAISGHAYLDPQLQSWVPADEYLSGDVRRKLEIAKFAVVNDPRLYHENVAKLTAIQPRDLQSHEIAVRLGAPWVPARVVRDFVIELLEPSYKDSTAVTRERVTATWTVDCPYGRTSKWGTTRVEAARLIELALNNETPVVYDRQRGPEGKDINVRNDAETLMACEKQAEIQDRFGQWVWEDSTRETELVELYNIRYNSTVLRSFSGGHLSWPSMAAWFEPYEHQKDMVARALGTQATACGHPVGAGKTAIMGMTAIKLRETGLTSKPCAVVPNHLVEQVSREIKALFPTKRILVVEKDDMKKERRKLFAAKVATGDWDLVVMAHSVFTMIPVDPATEREYVNEKIARYSEALNGIQSAGNSHGPSRGGNRTVKRIEKALEKLREKSRELLFKQTDDGVTWSQLGVSYLLLDECFEWGTMVLTDRGPLPIGQIVDDAMDVAIASVNTETGAIEYKPIHRWVKKAHAGDLVRITHEHGSIECTPNHPIWVDGVGYKRAEHVTSGDLVRFMEAATPLRGVRDYVHAGQAQAPVLRQLVRSDMAELATIQRELPVAVGGRDRCPDRTATAGLGGTDAGVEPDVRPGLQGEGLVFAEGSDLVVSAWRPRADDRAAEDAGRTAGAADGVLYLDPASGSSVRVAPELVRRGPGGPGIEAGDRGRRQLPQDPTLEVLGSAQDSCARSTRVVGVEVLERGSADGPRPGRGADPRGDGFVYNLEVAGNHNYFADGVLVSNCHYFKNLNFATRSRGGPPASKRAEDLALKLWALRRVAAEMPGHRNHVAMLLSGTLVSNTLAEMFVMQTYLQPERLEELEIEHFDAWAGLFVQNVTKIEVAPDGGSFRMHTRPAKFRNVPELRRMFGEVSDIRTKRQLGLPGPNVNFHTIVIPPTPELTGYVDALVKRADDVRSKRVEPTVDNMLKVCTDGRKAALDLELVGVWVTDPGKIGPVVDQLLAQWDPNAVYLGPDGNLSPTTGNLQVAFCDLGTPNSESTQVYGKIRAELIDRGMPPEKVRFIHEAKTDAAKAVLFAECRTGKVAVLLGSTDKLGVGTNIQHRMTDLHHIDAPWRPADVEQREGRGDRPGNQNATLNVWRYVRERSFDAYMWQGLERKAAFIAQVLTGDLAAREVEDIDSSTTLSFAEVKALATGNPLVMEQAEAAAEVARMKRLAEGHGQLQSRLRSDISTSQHWSSSYNRQAGEYEKLLAALGDVPGWRESRFGDTTIDLAAVGKAIGTKIVAQFSKSGMVSSPGGWVGGVELTLWTHAPKLVLGSNKAQIHAKIGGEDVELLTVELGWLREGRWHRIGEELARCLRPDGIGDKVADARARAAEEDVRRDRLSDQLTSFDKQPELDAAIARLDTILAAMADDMKAAATTTP